MKTVVRLCVATLLSAFLVSPVFAQAPGADTHSSGMNQGTTDKSWPDTKKEKARSGKSTGTDMNGGTYGDMLEKDKASTTYKSSKGTSEGMGGVKKAPAKKKATKSSKKSKAKKTGDMEPGMGNQ